MGVDVNSESTVKVGSGGTKFWTPGGGIYIPPTRNVTLANLLSGIATYPNSQE